MRFIVLSVLIVYSYAIPATQPATQAQIDADKQIISTFVATLKDSTKTGAEKQAAFNTALNSLQGPYKDQFNGLLTKFNETVNAIQSDKVKTLFQNLISKFQDGSLFSENHESLKSQLESQFSSFSSGDQEEAKKIFKTFAGEAKAIFQDILPAHAEKSSSTQ